MNKKILVAYVTKSGSTGEVAEAIGKALRECGATVDVRPVGDMVEITQYGALIVGSPILYGKWHSQAFRFLKSHQEVLNQIPVAYFIMCMELTRVSEEQASEMAVYLDPSLGGPPQVVGKLSAFEKGHLLSNFLNPVLKKFHQVKPFSVGVFRGKLDYSELDFISLLVMKFIWLVFKRAPEGDFRNWEAIQYWAASISPVFGETIQKGKQ